MLNNFFSWLERRVDSFPSTEPEMPEASTWGFIRFYTRPFLPLLAVGLAFAVAIAIIEVRIYAFVGRLIDMLGKADPTTFLELHWQELVSVVVVILVRLMHCFLQKERFLSIGLQD